MSIDAKDLMIGAGQNISRQLGIDSDATSSNGSEIVQMPTGIPLSSKGLISISAGFRHSIFVYDDGKIFATGDDRNDQIGQNEKKLYIIPTEVKISDEKIIQAACGQYYTAYLTENGSILIHGWRNQGNQFKVNLPVRFVFIAAGFDAPIAIDSEGALYIFDTYYIKEPIKVVGEKPFFDAARGNDFVIALDTAGSVYGNGILNNKSNELVKIPNLHGDRVFGSYQTVAILDNGKVYIKSSEGFEVVEALQDKKVVNMDVGQYYCIFVTDEAQIFGFGKNTYGELMLGRTDADHVPITHGPFQRMKINYAKCGAHFTFAIVNGSPIPHIGAKAFNVQ